MFEKSVYALAIADLRGLLKQLGKADFRHFGYTKQLRQYRVLMGVAPIGLCD